jgi:hypothetical protein
MKKTINKESFDGHLEKPLKQMTPKEKLLYLSAQIELRYYIKNNITRKKKK